MRRWITVKDILLYDVTLQEQINWVILGLNIYNTDGQRIIERDYGVSRPYGCEFLADYPGPYSGSDTKYYKWDCSHRLFIYFQYKTDELFNFLDKNKLLAIFFADTVHYLFKDQLTSSDFYKQLLNENLTEYKNEIKYLKNQIIQYKKSCNEDENQSKTSQANASRRIKAFQNWAITVEKSVSLAVACARNGKSKSIAQHKKMWRALWDGESTTLPRSEGFEAFRRGLPDDLKGN